MWNKYSVLKISIIGVLVLLVSVQMVSGETYGGVKALVEKYNQTLGQSNRIEIAKKLSNTEPTTKEDIENLRNIFSKSDWDEYIYAAGVESIKKVKEPSLDEKLIEILKDEKPLMERFGRGDSAGRGEGEIIHRMRNVMVIIHKLGQLKSQKAVPILKDYLAIKGQQYWASEALANIGDKSASEEMRSRAYEGQEINYGGLGLDEGINVIHDLQDKSKKDKWPKIAKQLVQIKDPKAKPYLVGLFNHEIDYVRGQSATAFSNMVDEGDVNIILDMSKNKDWFVRSRAIDAMKHLQGISFKDRLIDMLANDTKDIIRDHAAKALGYKKIASAVPYLEKALNDKAVSVREEAFIALYVLTGKKYDFAGKTTKIDKRAEYEKQSPSFW